MRIENIKREQLDEYFKSLDAYIGFNNPKWIKYLDLGCKTVRLLGFSDEFLGHVEKQMTFVLRDFAPKFDATIVLFKDDFSSIPRTLSKDFNPGKNLSLRVQMIASRKKEIDIYIFDKNYSKHNPIFLVEPKRGFLSAYNEASNTYYYGVKNLEPEEFIKEGHIFVQFFNKILKTEKSNLAHGALIGVNNNGILFCARGQRGKSTLSVLSMIRGFEYVSDDYLTLEKQEEYLYSYPIYSIITLSPRMYNELYNELDGSRFVSNNARKDKYVINIKNFHDRFKTKYPVKFCMFPEIVSDKEPSIAPCTSFEKGRAIVQLIQSTVSQMQDSNDSKTVKKLFGMVKGFNFYKINLCNDIEKNTEFLRNFTANYKEENLNQPLNNRMLVDITFDIANILDTKNMTLLNMNKSMTNIYKNLLSGVSKDKIIEILKTDNNMPQNIEDTINRFIEIARERELFALYGLNSNQNAGANEADINFDFIKEENYRFSFVEYNEDKTTELLNIEEKIYELCAK